MTKIEFNRLHWKCKVMATAFQLSVDRKWDSYKFARSVMTNKSIEWLYYTDDCQDWCDGYFLYSVFKYYLKGEKPGKQIDRDIMYFAGYLYKYWMITRNEDRKVIYKILPLKRLEASYEFYHTQGWDYVIDDAIRVYNNNEYSIRHFVWYAGLLAYHTFINTIIYTFDIV